MKTQRGVAVITAILIVAVAASAATFMLSQQSAMIDQALMVASRAQADFYADAGLDWARGVLAEDARRAGGVDHLGEGWAQPIAALPVERAVVAGAIEDEQGKFNLNNLVAAGRSEADLKILQRILVQLALAPELADAIMDWADADQDVTGNGGAENPYYFSLSRPYRAANQPFVQVEELFRVRGFDAKTVAALRPYVTALPGKTRTAININTASDVVLLALFDGKVPRDQIAEWIAIRRAKPFTTTAEIAKWAPKADPTTVNTSLGVKSDFFSARVQVAQDDVQIATEALMQRNPQGGAVTLVWRRAIY
jgi:general secretion pathway protein K